MAKPSNKTFRNFVDIMDASLRELESTDGRDQKTLLNDLFAVEDEFKTVLLSTPEGTDMYRKFVDFILKEGASTNSYLKEGFIPKTKKGVKKFQEKVAEEGRNILRARPYFRERQNTFSRKISKAFHENCPEILHKFKINYEFAKWALEGYKGQDKRKLTVIFNKIKEIREILCINNLPLAINRAHLFWSRIPESHMEYMDFIQACSEGLVTAIDKFVPPYKTVFRSTAIGRMTLNMTEGHNSTLVKLPPKEKRILYRAKNAKYKASLTEQSAILAYVQESFKGVTSESLSELEAATSKVVDIYEKQEDSHSLSELLPDNSLTVDEQAEANDLKDKLSPSVKKLKTLEIKVLKLKMGDM